MNLRLERSNKELEQFAYAASHDLQEPLRMIASFTKLLANRIEVSNDRKTQENFNIILEAAKRMQHPVHDLLDYSRVTTKGTVFAPFEMGKVVSDVLLNLKIAISENDAKSLVTLCL